MPSILLWKKVSSAMMAEAVGGRLLVPVSVETTRMTRSRQIGGESGGGGAMWRWRELGGPAARDGDGLSLRLDVKLLRVPGVRKMR